MLLIVGLIRMTFICLRYRQNHFRRINLSSKYFNALKNILDISDNTTGQVLLISKFQVLFKVYFHL